MEPRELAEFLGKTGPITVKRNIDPAMFFYADRRMIQNEAQRNMEWCLRATKEILLTVVSDNRKYDFELGDFFHFTDPKPPFEHTVGLKSYIGLRNPEDAEIGEYIFHRDRNIMGLAIIPGKRFHYIESHLWRRVE